MAPVPPWAAPTIAWPPGARPCGGQPVRQFVGQERLPLPGAVGLPVGVGVNAPLAGATTEMPLPARGVHRVARGHPVADRVPGVVGVQQHHRVRAAGQEGHRDVAAHGGRGHHQGLDAVGGTRRGGGPPHSRASTAANIARNRFDRLLIPTSRRLVVILVTPPART